VRFSIRAHAGELGGARFGRKLLRPEAVGRIGLDVKRPIRELFARCFAEEHGDEAKTRARYLLLRALEIEKEEEAEMARRQPAAVPQKKDRVARSPSGLDALPLSIKLFITLAMIGLIILVLFGSRPS